MSDAASQLSRWLPLFSAWVCGQKATEVAGMFIRISSILLEFARGDTPTGFGLFEMFPRWAARRTFAHTVEEVHEVLVNSLMSLTVFQNSMASTISLRPPLIAFPAAGLAVGFALHLSEREAWAGWVWAVSTAPMLLALLVQIVASLRRGEVGLDIVAACP